MVASYLAFLSELEKFFRAREANPNNATLIIPRGEGEELVALFPPPPQSQFDAAIEEPNPYYLLGSVGGFNVKIVRERRRNERRK